MTLRCWSLFSWVFVQDNPQSRPVVLRCILSWYFLPWMSGFLCPCFPQKRTKTKVILSMFKVLWSHLNKKVLWIATYCVKTQPSGIWLGNEFCKGSWNLVFFFYATWWPNKTRKRKWESFGNIRLRSSNNIPPLFPPTCWSTAPFLSSPLFHTLIPMLKNNLAIILHNYYNQFF